MNRSHAAALAREAAEALAGLEPAPLVTLDGDEANDQATHCPIVLIQPPRTRYETYSQATASWTVYLISSRSDTTEAWDELDLMAEALRLPLDVDEATPATFQPPRGAGIPALSLTLTTEHYI